MKVINISSDGTEIKDISKITVPIDNSIYDVCQGLMECQSSVSQSG